MRPKQYRSHPTRLVCLSAALFMSAYSTDAVLTASALGEALAIVCLGLPWPIVAVRIYRATIVVSDQSVVFRTVIHTITVPIESVVGFGVGTVGNGNVLPWPACVMYRQNEKPLASYWQMPLLPYGGRGAAAVSELNRDLQARRQAAQSSFLSTNGLGNARDAMERRRKAGRGNTRMATESDPTVTPRRQAAPRQRWLIGAPFLAISVAAGILAGDSWWQASGVAVVVLLVCGGPDLVALVRHIRRRR